jgi:tetratricopeptide (TPR) repeat protein
MKYQTPIALALMVTLASSSAGAQAPPAKGEAAAQAEAERARKERDARVPTVVEEKAREKVEAVTEPTLDYQSYRRQAEVKVASKRQELIRYLDEILKQNPPDEERPDLLFQKAELFLEEAQYWFFEANRLDDQIAAALSAGDDAKMMAASEKKDQLLAKQKKWGDDAIKIFEEIEKKYKKFERLPDVLYMMGQAYWDRGDLKQALAVYRKLIKDHPKTQYLSDAWLAFGEYYFQVGPEEDRDVNKALDAYVKAAANQESAVFGYATYKQGWCHYNLSRHDKAVRSTAPSSVSGALVWPRKPARTTSSPTRSLVPPTTPPQSSRPSPRVPSTARCSSDWRTSTTATARTAKPSSPTRRS